LCDCPEIKGQREKTGGPGDWEAEREQRQGVDDNDRNAVHEKIMKMEVVPFRMDGTDNKK